jgi:AAA15 family ATPase/GTPase
LVALSGLRIANFKAFAASQRVPLRPITLVYGANSAGKSSILHALG